MMLCLFGSRFEHPQYALFAVDLDEMTINQLKAELGPGGVQDGPEAGARANRRREDARAQDEEEGELAGEEGGEEGEEGEHGGDLRDKGGETGGATVRSESVSCRVSCWGCRSPGQQAIRGHVRRVPTCACPQAVPGQT